MQIKDINDIKIRPVVHLSLEPTEILGYDYFPTLYSNIFVCSKRRSGKTTLIYNILKHCVSKRTNVVFFCSTIHRDSTYKLILEMLAKKKVNVVSYDHFIDGKEKFLNAARLLLLLKIRDIYLGSWGPGQTMSWWALVLLWLVKFFSIGTVRH